MGIFDIEDPRFSEEKSNVFISYSWDDEEHKVWVAKLASAIEQAGGNSLLDQEHLKFGGNMSLFMESMIKRSDVVLMILTPAYKEKADNRYGGVGYEYNIITNSLYRLRQNEKYIPVLRQGNFDSAVPVFLQSYICADLREGDQFEANLDALLKQILDSPLKQPKKKKLMPAEIEYLHDEQLKSRIDLRFHHYFNRIFNFSEEADKITIGGARIKSDTKNQKKKLQKEISDWKIEIEGYCRELQEAFTDKKMLFFDRRPGEFKSKSFRNHLWTVSSALRTRDPDLAGYKKNFSDVTAEEVLETVQLILGATRSYIDEIGKNLDYYQIEEIKELQMDYLNEDGMFLNKIIGYGIRSEILHRMFPAHFPIMTQRTIWAMYFLTEREREFITFEQKSRTGIMRVSHNWQYDYARFTYYNNYVGNLLREKLREFDIQLDPKQWFGFVNLFLVELALLHKEDIKLLHEWSDI